MSPNAAKRTAGRPGHGKKQLGLSLIELMVGIVVAMLAVIIVMQIFQVTEGRRRTTTGGDDAQTTGAIALSILQRDLQQAGLGFADNDVLGCTLTLDSGHAISNLGSVTINHPSIPAGDANTDTLLVMYGSASVLPEGNRITSQPGPAVYVVESPYAFRNAEWVITAPQVRLAACALNMTQVSGAPEIATSRVTVTSGMLNASDGYLFNLGTTPVVRAYAVRNGQLTVCDYRAANCALNSADSWVPTAEAVMGLRAQYAVDSSLAPDGVVDGYDTTTPATAADWGRVRGIRLALVVRSGQLEKDEVTGVAGGASAPSWAGSASSPLTLSGSNWKNFRYRTSEVTIPLPNIPPVLP